MHVRPCGTAHAAVHTHVVCLHALGGCVHMLDNVARAQVCRSVCTLYMHCECLCSVL